jgi:23S rRNA-/tRNA-specific pseudouridylate synthase
MSAKPEVFKYILYEDEVVIVLDKPAGLMVEPDRNGYPNLLQQVRSYLQSSLPPGEEVYAQHIHRLDRPVRGVVLFAKQRAVLKNLSEQFAERRVKKYYRALTAEAPPILQGSFEHWHRKEKKKAILYENETDYAEKARLDYQVSPLSENRFVWTIKLHTGKYHQIRAQLAQAGCPVIGDSAYGSAVSYEPDAIALSAWRLVFYHPLTNHEMTVQSRMEL